MKYLLIIDIPDNEEFDYRKCNMGGDKNIYYSRDGERDSIIGNIKNIKPIPQKYNEGIMREQKGWNRCIDEILGE